jgi:hypothetical protein
VFFAIVLGTRLNVDGLLHFLDLVLDELGVQA